MKSIIMNSKNAVIGIIVDGDAGNVVEVAGALTTGGDPVNVRAYRVSRSVRNLARAERTDAQIATRHVKGARVFYTLGDVGMEQAT